jgi:hypothetical protein
VVKEALSFNVIALYLQHLKADGIIAFHVANIQIDLFDVVRQLAKSQGNLLATK